MKWPCTWVIVASHMPLEVGLSRESQIEYGAIVMRCASLAVCFSPQRKRKLATGAVYEAGEQKGIEPHIFSEGFPVSGTRHESKQGSGM